MRFLFTGRLNKRDPAPWSNQLLPRALIQAYPFKRVESVMVGPLQRCPHLPGYVFDFRIAQPRNVSECGQCPLVPMLVLI